MIVGIAVPTTVASSAAKNMPSITPAVTTRRLLSESITCGFSKESCSVDDLFIIRYSRAMRRQLDHLVVFLIRINNPLYVPTSLLTCGGGCVRARHATALPD
jgi:hypothetical protein